MTGTYGAYHYTFDALGIAKSLLDDPAILASAMEAIVPLVGMTQLADTIILQATDPHKAWGTGVDVIVPLVDSHLILHTLLEWTDIYFELFSCKLFDDEMLTRLLRGYFEPPWCRWRWWDRTVGKIGEERGGILIMGAKLKRQVKCRKGI